MIGENAMAADDVPARAMTSGVHTPVRKTAQEVEAWRIRKSIGLRKTNTSGCPGVRLHKKSGLWHARITANYREISLGYFRIYEAAVAARRAGEVAHLFSNKPR